MTRQIPRVLILAGGGLAHTSGGVGTLMAYVMQAWRQAADAPAVRVIDTRGQGGRAAGAGRFVAVAGRLAWHCASGKADLVHAHMTTRGSVLRKALLCSLAARFGTPFVVHMHGADFAAFHAGLRPLWRAALRHVLRRAGRVVVLGTGWRDFLVRDAGLDPARVEIVLNGVARPPAAVRRAPGQPRILFLGRMGDRKGVPELLAALDSPGLRVRAWQATIAGDGEVARFRAMRDGLGLEARIDMPGWVDRAAAGALLAGADILVLPSHHEALPMAVIEALAHRVAVITTPVGAVPEFLEHDVSALLVTPGDVAGLTAALAALLDDPQARDRLAGAGHAVFAARLDVTVTADRLLAIYRDVARPPSVRGWPKRAGVPA